MPEQSAAGFEGRGDSNRLRKSSDSSSDVKKDELSHDSIETETDIPLCAARDNILETVVNSDRKTFYSSDLSIYRTPSGKYYCQPCNRTVHSQTQFLQHLDSRRHRHKTDKASSLGLK